MAVRFRFVDKIDAAPTVRLDLHASPWTLLGSEHGTNFDPPPLKRALADSGVLRDGALQAASAYDNRTVKAALLLEGTSQDLLADDLQDLNRELNRPANILEYRPEGATKSVFFRTYRSPDYELFADLPEAGSSSLRVLIAILAEPFGLGLRVDLDEVTVDGDPAAGTNPNYYDVTGVLGDVATPAVYRLKRAGDVNVMRQIILAARQHGTPSNTTYLIQAEALTQGTDTTTQANSATFSGSSNNYSRTTPGTATDAERLSGTAILAGGEDLVGTYRVFLRARGEVVGAIWSAYLSWGNPGTAGEFINNDPVTIERETNSPPELHDLGLVNNPIVPAWRDGYGDTLGSAGFDIGLYAARTSGTGSLDWDYLIFVPADESLMIAQDELAAGLFSDVRYGFIDGINEVVYTTTTSDATRVLTTGERASFVGGVAMLLPNHTNRLYVIGKGTVNYHWIGTDTLLRISYWPRWLYIRP